MKPIRLELKEFGPYKNEIIEWDKIINEPIFLITGKTGSGKSTLFDAITYALYNKTTGGKDIASLRTKTALDKDKTQVNFDFELSGKKYRIERTLAYLKAGNKNLTSGKVALMQYTDEKLEVIASKEQEVKEKVEELIGLDDKQFCQIIILPQGKFKEFLLSKSSEKKETLRSLFNTYFYQKFVEQLQEQAKKLDSSHKQKEKELITRFEQFDIEEELTKFEYLKDENFEEILSIIQLQEETIKIEKKELLKLERSFSKEKENFIELSKLNDKFSQLKSNKSELEELSGKEDYYSRLKLEVEKLKELQKSKDKIIEYSTLLNKQSQLRKLEKDLLIDTEKYKLDLENNKKLELELNKQKNDIEVLRKETIDYKFFYNNLNELNLAKTNIEIYNKSLEELTLKKETYKELDSSLKVEKESYLEDIEEKNILESSIGKLKLEVLKKEQDVEKLEEYNNKLSEVNDKSLKLTLDKKKLEELEVEKKKLEQEVELLNKNKEREILNDFLLKLHEGDDCPLCKQKIEHLPDIPDLAVVDESIEKSLQKVNKDIIQLEALIKKDEEEIGKISTLLKNLEDTINFKAKEELSQLEGELKAENIKLTDISKVIKISDDKIKGLNREIEELSELFKNEDEIKQNHLEAKNKIEQFEKNVKVELDEFAGYYEKIQSQVEDFDNTCNALQNNSSELLVRKTKLETEQKNNKENLLEVSKRIENIVDSFTNSKLNKYYITLEMAEENIAELNNLENYESQINKFEDTKKIIVNSIEKLEEELKELNQPDLEEEQQKLQNIESQVNDFIEKVAILNTRLENNKKLYGKIHSEYINLLESSKDIREIIAFSDVVSGKTENRK